MRRAAKQTGHPVSFPGHFQCLGLLGSGGQGDAWLGWDPMLKRKVVCKRLRESPLTTDATRPSYEPTPAAYSRASACSRAIQQVLGVEFVEGVSWLILEYIEGRTLAEFVSTERSRLGVAQVLLVLLELLDILEALRTAELVHGDITPANVLIDDLGRVRLIDLSCTTSIGDERPASGVHGFRRLGPAGFNGSSPEDDQHAVGCLLYWLLKVDLPEGARDASGDGLMIRARRPAHVAGLLRFLWDCADVLTGGVSGNGVAREALLAAVRREARLLDPACRHALLATQSRPARRATAVGSATSVDGGLDSNERPAVKLADVGAPQTKRPTDLGRWLLPIRPNCLALLPLLTLAVGVLFWLPGPSSTPTLVTSPARISANTLLPNGFSMEWVSEGLRRSVSRHAIESHLAGKTWLVGVRCQQQACILSLKPTAEEQGQPLEHRFFASRDPAAWDLAISELGRRVAAR